MRRALELGSLVVFEYYGLLDHGAVVTFRVDDENHFRLMNGQNVFLPKREKKMDTPTHAGRLQKKRSEERKK